MLLSVNLKVCLISCPGVRLQIPDSKVFLKVMLFNSYGISSHFSPKFPVIVYEEFYFVKRFNCDHVLQLLKLLSDEEIVIQLMSENDLIISKFKCNAKQFLYPKPQLGPKYSKSSRYVLMDSCLLPISPKLEFKTINSITENISNGLESDSSSDLFIS